MRQRNVGKLAWMLALLMCAPAIYAQQEVRTNVTLTTGTSLSFTMSVANASTAAVSLVGFDFTPNAMINIDTMGTMTPGAKVVPNIGPKDEANPVTAGNVNVTFTSPLMPGQTWTVAGGDLDPVGTTALTSITLAMHYSDGKSVTLPLVKGGGTSTTWTGTIVVSTVPVFPVRLSWQAPTTNVDNTPYTNAAGYKIYWGTMQGTYASSRTVADPAVLAIDVPLPLGQYYFVATAYNTLNDESAYSNVASGNAGPDPSVPLLSAVASTSFTTNDPEGVVYVMFQSHDNIALVPWGTLPIHTPCNGKLAVRDVQRGDMYLVPIAGAHPYDNGASFDQPVFAKCSVN